MGDYVHCIHCGASIPVDVSLGTVIKPCPRCGFEMHIIIPTQSKPQTNVTEKYSNGVAK
jgi:hypothetical protein